MTDEFQRLGIFGDWDHPYLTMDFGYQAAIARALGKFVEQGLVYKGKKPVHWCIHCRTALAEAEVEYEDHASPSIYVEFPLRAEAPASLRRASRRSPAATVSVLIWTTTPWTIPSNLAIAFHPGVRLRRLRRRRPRRDRRRGAGADRLPRQTGKTLGAPVARMKGAALEHIRFQHPLYAARFARRARRLRHARAGHGRGAHGARVTAPTTSTPACATASTSTRRSDPAATSSTRSSCSPVSVCSTRTRRSRRRSTSAAGSGTGRLRSTRIRTAGGATTRSSSWRRRSGSSAWTAPPVDERRPRRCGRRALDAIDSGVDVDLPAWGATGSTTCSRTGPTGASRASARGACRFRRSTARSAAKRS